MHDTSFVQKRAQLTQEKDRHKVGQKGQHRAPKQSQRVPVAFSLISFWPPGMQLKDVAALGNSDNQSSGTCVGANPELQLNKHANSEGDFREV